MVDSWYTNCVAEVCEAMPECTVCHRRKPPRGRDVATAAANGYCGYECSGYLSPPHAGHLWPGELAQIRGESTGGEGGEK